MLNIELIWFDMFYSLNHKVDKSLYLGCIDHLGNLANNLYLHLLGLLLSMIDMPMLSLNMLHKELYILYILMILHLHTIQLGKLLRKTFLRDSTEHLQQFHM